MKNFLVVGASSESFTEDFNLQDACTIKLQQKVMPLKATGSGSIVLFSTVAVSLGFTSHSQVAASKGAIESLVHSLAAEWAPDIHINAIAPSLTETPLAAHLLNSPEKKEANAHRHPLKRVGRPEDIASTVQFLLSENANWITGQIIHTDGGMSAIKS
jgi:NAD(P)-dependent dehydrogenase (short-subunit alcohol dehydrogenase family)